MSELVCREAVKHLIDVDLKSLVGEILTLIDGVIQEETARKASKDMAKRMLWDFGGKVKSSINNLETSEESYGECKND